MIVSVRGDHQDRRVTGLVINLHCRIDAKRDLVGRFRKDFEIGDVVWSDQPSVCSCWVLLVLRGEERFTPLPSKFLNFGFGIHLR